MATDFPASPAVNDVHSVGNTIWFWNGVYWELQANTTKYTSGDNAPANTVEGDFWFESDTGRLFVRYDSTWVEVGHASDAQTFQASDTIPTSGVVGDIWFESDTGKTFMYYDSTWVEIGHASDFGTDQISYNIDGGKSGTVYGGITALNGGSSAS